MKIRKELLFIAAVLSMQNAFAVDAPSVSQIQSIKQQIDPGRVQQGYVPSISAPLRQTTPVVAQESKTAGTLPPEFQKITFHLTKLDVTGSTVYSSNDLAPFYQKFIGKEITLAQLYGVAQAITDKYHNDGYLLSQAIIPPQRIQSGTAKIQVVEGYVAKVTVQGDANGATSKLQSYGQQIIAERPLRVQTLERYALLANDIPGLDVQAVLAPSKQEVGAADLTFIAHAKRFDALASFDNRGTVFYGPYEYTAQADVNNVLAANQTGIQGLATKDLTQLQYMRLWHNVLLGSDGLQLQIAGSLTRTNPGGPLEPIDVTGQSNELITALNYPILRSRRQNLYANLEFDALDSLSYSFVGSVMPGLLFKDKIRSLRLGGTYERTDSWLGVNSVNLQASQGLNIFGAPDHTIDPPTFEPMPSRPAGRTDYTKFNANISRMQYLPYNFSLMFAGAAQYALNPLLSPEQIGYGGRIFGRAYDPSEITGDSGWEGSIELRYTHNPNLFLLQSAQYYLYYDGGEVYNRDTVSGQPASASGTSAGVGIRFSFTEKISGGIEVDKPLTRPVSALSTAATSTTPGYYFTNPRIFFYIQGLL